MSKGTVKIERIKDYTARKISKTFNQTTDKVKNISGNAATLRAIL